MIVQLCPFVKLFAYGEGFTTTINLKCMVLHVDHWLVDIWLKQGRERRWSSPRMGEAQKTQSKNRQQYKKHRLQWTVFIIFVSQFHFSSLYVRTLTFSTAGCQASNTQARVAHRPAVPHSSDTDCEQSEASHRLPTHYYSWTEFPHYMWLIVGVGP